MEQLLAQARNGHLLRYALWLLVLGAVVGWGAIFFAGASSGAFDPSSIDTGDTAWMLVAAALVMLMTPAVGFFYGGMVSSKNVVSVLKQSLVIFSLITVQWAVIGYSLAFAPDVKGIIGNLDFFGLRGVGFAPDANYA